MAHRYPPLKRPAPGLPGAGFDLSREPLALWLAELWWWRRAASFGAPEAS